MLCYQSNKKWFSFVFAYDKRSYEDLFVLSTLKVAGPCIDIFYDGCWGYVSKELVMLPAAKRINQGNESGFSASRTSTYRERCPKIWPIRYLRPTGAVESLASW